MMTPKTNQSSAYFVTGTDTEIGKTLVSSALIRAFSKSGRKTVGMKPVCAGAYLNRNRLINEDVESLVKASSLQMPLELTAPYILREPASPHIAAKNENRIIKPDNIFNAYEKLKEQSEVIIIEGVGGFVVPLSDNYNTADMAKRFNLPVIMVVGLRLGCINHAILTAEAIKSRRLKLAAWVANIVAPKLKYQSENISAIQKGINAPLLGIIPHLKTPDADNAAKYINISPLQN